MKKLKGILLVGLVVGILAGGAATVVSADSYKQDYGDRKSVV